MKVSKNPRHTAWLRFLFGSTFAHQEYKFSVAETRRSLWWVLGQACLVVFILSASTVAGSEPPLDSSFSVSAFVQRWHLEYAIDYISGEPWVYMSIRPPHTYDESALEGIGEFVSARDDGPGLYRIRVRDLPVLYSYTDAKFTYCKGVHTSGSGSAGSPGEVGSIQLTMDLPTGVSLPGYTLRIYRAKSQGTPIDSTDQIRRRFWQAFDLRGGVVENGLPAGEYVCYLVAPLVDRATDPGVAKVAERCSDVFISGVVVEEGSTTQVHVSYDRFESRAESILRTFGDRLAIRHTDSGDYMDVLFKMAEGSTFYELDSAGVNYEVWGEGLYSAQVPVTQAFELGSLNSVEWVHYCEKMHLNQPDYARRQSPFGSMQLTIGLSSNVAAPRYTLRVYSVNSADSVVDTTSQVFQQECKLSDLRGGVIVDSLATGYYQCHLVTLPVESNSDVYPEIYIFGIVVSEGYMTPVSVADGVPELHAAETETSRSRYVIRWRLEPGETFIREQ